MDSKELPRHDNPEVLASSKDFGCVLRCPAGCVHICVGNLTLRLDEKKYWTLMAMLSESALHIAKPEEKKQSNVH